MQGPGSLGIQTQIVISSSGGAQGTGLFEYSGTPGPGNPPIAWAVANGVTKDPFGNTLIASGGFISKNNGFAGATAFSQLANEILKQVDTLGVPWISQPTVTSGFSQYRINDQSGPPIGVVFTKFGDFYPDTGTYLLYNASISGIPTKGQLIMAVAGPTSHGTDEAGNVYPHGFNFGTWDVTGVLRQHFGIDTGGNSYWANSTPAQVQGFCNSTQGTLNLIDDDTNSYDVERRTLRLTSDVTISTTGAVGVFPVNPSLKSGRAYRVRVWLGIVSVGAVGTYTLALSGPTAPAPTLTGFGVRQAAVTAQNWTAGGYASGGSSSSTTAGWVEFHGTIAPSATGALNVLGNISAGGSNLTIKAGSFMEIEPCSV